MAEKWQPETFIYQPETSLTESWGGRARKLWGEKLARFSEMASESSAVIFSEIGIGIPGIEVPGGGLMVHKDGSNLPDIGKLMELHRLKTLPQVIFIVASALHGEHINAVAGLARELKENGVQAVIPLLTSMAHERQDHKFTDKKTGQRMNQVTTLKEAVETLARYCDGALVLQPHSHRGVELGLRLNFPILPIEGLGLLLNRSGYQGIQNLIELGPDFGRQDEARKAAAFFNCPLLSVEKVRDRIHGGKPIIIWPQGAREWIRDNGCTVVTTDDELRDAGTMDAIADGLERYTSDVRIIAVKAIMSDEVRPRMMIRNGQLVRVEPRDEWAATSAVEKLNKPQIREILITDAVQPLADLTPIAEKIRIISLKPEIEALVGYLRQNWIPLSESWLRDPHQTGTLLSLDLAVEKHK